MVLRVAARARATWVSLDDRDFDAVTDLVKAFIETPEPRVWAHLDVVGQVPPGVVVCRAGGVLVLVRRAGPLLFGLGVVDG